MARESKEKELVKQIYKKNKPRMANGGSENFKEESLPNSFNEIEKEMNC